MPDSPDFQKYLPGSVRFSLQDFGELAARLDSISTYDRRGEVLWYDKFSYGMAAWGLTASGSGSVIRIDTSNIYRWPHVCKILSGIVLNDLSAIVKYLSPVSTGRYGIEFVLDIESAVTDFEVYLNLWDKTYLYQARFRFLDSGDLMQLRNASGVYETVVSLRPWVSGWYIYNPIKFVIDMNLEKYVRLLIGSTAYNVSAITLNKQASTDPTNAFIQLSTRSASGTNAHVRIAHVILTANEP